MTELRARIDQALDRAAEYELLGSLAADPERRAEYRKLARQQQRLADDLRGELPEDDEPASPDVRSDQCSMG